MSDMEKQFWLVWNPKGYPATSQYNTIESARTEAERMAKDYGSNNFYVLEAVAECRRADVNWRMVGEHDPSEIGPDDDGTPF